MGIVNKFLSNAGTLLAEKAINNSVQLKDDIVSLYRAGSGLVQDMWERQAIYPKWYFTAVLGQPRKIDVWKLREFANSTWAQMVLNTIKKQVYTIKWDIVPADEDDETDYTDKIKIVKERLKTINNNNETISDLNSSLISDIGEIDAGVINYVYSMDSYDIGEVPIYDSLGQEIGKREGLILKPLGQRKLTQIKSVDGGSVLKQVDIYKNLLGYYQYSFKHPRQNPTRFDPQEIAYLIMNKKPYDIYGFSPIQSIQQVLELLIQGTRYNKDFFKNNAVPDTLITLPKLDDPALKRLKRKWNNSYKGKPHQVGFVNWAVDKIHQLTASNRDMEWLDGQKWYSKIVFACFGLSPVEAGFFENANKSNDEGQERSSVRNAIKPYLKLLEDIHTSRSITEILQDENHGLRFKFFPKDHAVEKIEFEQDMKELETGVMTINEYRKKKGRDPVEWGDEPLRKPMDPNMMGFNPMNPRQPPMESGNQNNPKKDENNKKPLSSSKNLSPKTENCSNINEIDKSIDLLPGDDIVDESEDYSDFLLNLFNKMEDRVLRAADKLVIDKSYTHKNFADFLKDMFNAVNTVAFAKHVRKFIQNDMIKGLKSAEDELNMDIGKTSLFEQKMNVLAEQQLNGYSINGKMWFGIKGVTKEIQHNVIAAVQSGLAEKKGLDDIKKDIQKTFDNFSDWRSEMIARTETNRILNEGKIVGYKESGMKGKKVWKTAIDHRTSDICRRLNGQAVDLDDDFVDPDTMKAYHTPPGHPNCRSVVIFRPE